MQILTDSLIGCSVVIVHVRPFLITLAGKVFLGLRSVPARPQARNMITAVTS